MTNNTKQHGHSPGLKYVLYTIILLTLISICGCNGDKKLIESSYSVADELIRQLPPPDTKESPILTASFVNIDNLEKSSTLGRLISEYISSRFVQRGYNVAELKIRNSVYMKAESGEFLLSRDLKHLNTEHETSALIVGTYSVAADTVYLSARVVSPETSKIIATYDYSVPINSNISKMLSGR